MKSDVVRPKSSGLSHLTAGKDRPGNMANAAVQAKAFGAREEHLAWAKERAGEYLDQGDIASAYASFVSDQGKHKDLCYDQMLLSMGMMHMSSVHQMRNFIDGFN